MRPFIGVAAIVVSGVMTTGPALAQEGPQAKPDKGSDVVIITAQKREEDIQDVPLAVTALSAEALESAGITGSRDLMYVTPGLVFTQGAFVARPQIRGIGTRAVGPGDEATVPIYIDGVYQSMQDTGFFDFSNVQRVEVLKGPQGTLFGRNAVAGAINVVTKDPGFNPEADIALSYTSIGESTVDFAGNLPITDQIAGNLAVHATKNDGYIDDLSHAGNDGQSSSVAARTKLLWKPSDKFSAILGGSYTNTYDKSSLSNHPIDGNTVARRVDPLVPLADGLHSQLNEGTYLGIHSSSVWTSVNYKLQAFDIDFNAAWQQAGLRTKSDTDGTIVPYATAYYGKEDESYQAELRATSTGAGRLQWIAGLFLFSDEAGYGQGDDSTLFRSRGSPTGSTLSLRSLSKTSSYAAFAEATYSITDAFLVTAGLRYSQETRDFEQAISQTPAGQPFRPVVANGPAVSSDFDNLSPRLSVQWHITDTVRTYATYSEGFKSGLYNATTTTLPLKALRPEVLDSYEIGLKTEPFANVRFNVSGYYYDYTDLQVSARNSAGGNEVQNAAGAEIYGSEAELQWAVTPEFSLNGAVAYNHARFSNFPGAQIFIPRPGNDGYDTAFGDASGNALPKAPDWTYNLSAVYETPFAGGSLQLSGSYYHSGDYFSDLGNSYLEPSYDNVNAQIAWAPNGGFYRVSVFVDNLTDDRRLLTNTLSAAGQTGVLAPPFSFGAKLQFFIG